MVTKMTIYQSQILGILGLYLVLKKTYISIVQQIQPVSTVDPEFETFKRQ